MVTGSTLLLDQARYKSLYTFLATVDKLPRVHALRSNKQFLPQFISVWISEHYSCQWCSTTGVVDDFLHYPLHIRK